MPSDLFIPLHLNEWMAGRRMQGSRQEKQKEIERNNARKQKGKVQGNTQEIE